MKHNLELTLNEHREMGRSLKEARNALLSDFVKLANTYSQARLPSNKLSQAVDLINEVMNKLDDKIFEEHPELDAKEKIGYYYCN